MIASGQFSPTSVTHLFNSPQYALADEGIESYNAFTLSTYSFTADNLLLSSVLYALVSDCHLERILLL